MCYIREVPESPEEFLSEAAKWQKIRKKAIEEMDGSRRASVTKFAGTHLEGEE